MNNSTFTNVLPLIGFENIKVVVSDVYGTVFYENTFKDAEHLENKDLLEDFNIYLDDAYEMAKSISLKDNCYLFIYNLDNNLFYQIKRDEEGIILDIFEIIDGEEVLDTECGYLIIGEDVEDYL